MRRIPSIGVLAVLATSPLAPAARATDGAPAWEHLGPAAGGGRAELRVTEASGSRLFVRGGRLHRARDGEVRRLATSDGADSGPVRSVARDPAGSTLVAAERGLFLLSPEVDVLHPVALGPEAPSGAPTSLVVDRERRVWLATEDGFGAVDAAFFDGRAFTRDDGLPPARSYRVRADREGGVLVEADGELFRYRPDTGPPPEVLGLTVDGVDVRPGGEVAVRGSSSVRAAASDGARLRYRLDGHHVWRPLEGELSLADTRPGRHRLDVVAVDRDLRTSAPLSVHLVVDYPAHYSRGFVLSVAAVAALAALGLFGLSARRRPPGRTAPRPLLSAAITAVLALQALAAVVPHTHGWPFVGFGMYTDTCAEGDVAYEAVVAGLRSNGAWFDLRRRCSWSTVSSLVDGGAEGARRLARGFEERHPGVDLAGLQVRVLRRRLTRAGPVPVAPLVYLDWRDAEGGSER